MKKILFIVTEFPPGPGGIGNHAWNLARNINKKIPIDVLAVSDYADYEMCESFDENEKYLIYRFKRYWLSLFTYLHRMFIIIKFLIKNEYSHCIVSGFFSLLTIISIKILNKNIIVCSVLHGSELIHSNPIIKYILSKNLKKIDILISVSNYTNSLIPLELSREQKSYIIPNGVNKNLYKASSFNYNIIGNPCLLTVGSITHRKGQINLINALPLIKKKYPDVHYHCVGLPIEEDSIAQLIKSLQLDDYVTLHGVIGNNRLGDFYKNADILVMLSQSNIDSCAEGFGIAILEANLFGTSAIGSKDTGIEDAIYQNKTGILVDPYCSKEILSSIDNILSNKQFFSKNSKAWAKEHFWNNITEKYLKVMFNE
tara:strand:- start:4005 stop:5114 length:1110 start_codon:yes stop_codon:yes gene_type:complete